MPDSASFVYLPSSRVRGYLRRKTVGKHGIGYDAEHNPIAGGGILQSTTRLFRVVFVSGLNHSGREQTLDPDACCCAFVKRPPWFR